MWPTAVTSPRVTKRKGEITMARQRKPRAYLKHVCNGWFAFEPVYMWVAYNDWGNSVAWGKTRRECEKECRWDGYVPESY